MALAAPIISVQDGTAAAANNFANNSVVTVTPGNAVTFALQSSTGVQFAFMNITGIPGAPAPVGQTSPIMTGNGPFSWTILMPPGPSTSTLNVIVTDGFNPSVATYTIVASATKPLGIVHRARGVVTTNETLTAFDSVSGGTIRDGVTYVQGDTVLLVAQSTGSQNGLYVVGAVASGSAPLTRAPDYTTGTVFDQSNRPIVEIGPEGSHWGFSTWKLFTTGAVTVDTTSAAFYPRMDYAVTGSGSGSVAQTGTSMYIASTTVSQVFVTTNTAAGTQTSQLPTLTAGAGSGKVSLAIGGSDTSKYNCTVVNF